MKDKTQGDDKDTKKQVKIQDIDFKVSQFDDDVNA